MPVIRGLLKLVVAKLMKSVETEAEFWKEYYLAAAGSLTRADLDTRYRAEITFDEHFGDLLSGLDDWPGEILILEGSEDPVTKKKRELSLDEAYPRARKHVFEGAGHGPSLERPEEWQTIVCEFLLGSGESVG